MSILSIVNNTYVKNIAAVVAVTVLLVILIFWWLNVYTKHGDSVVVPDVKGVTVREAIPFLKSKGLRYEVVDSIYAKNKKPGVICEQIPRPNSTVKPNRIVFLTINSFSSRQIVLPDVRDLSQRQAEVVLQNAGFTTSVMLVSSNFKDLVIRVKKGDAVVYPGTKFIDGTRLTLEVGDGSGSGGVLTPDSLKKESNSENSSGDDSWF